MLNLKSEHEGTINELIDYIVNLTNDGVVLCDINRSDHPLIFVNHAFELITGYGTAEIMGKNCRFLQNSDTDQSELAHLRHAIQQKKRGSAIVKNYTKSGTAFWNQISLYPLTNKERMRKSCRYYAGIIKDVTEEVQLRSKVDYYREHDYVTGLYNYLGFYYQAKQLIQFAEQQTKLIGMGMLKVCFAHKRKGVVYEFTVDTIISRLAKELRKQFREKDIIAKLVGHQFVFVMLVETEEYNWFKKRIVDIEKRVNAGLPDDLHFSLPCSFFIERPQHATSVDHLITKASEHLVY